MKRAFALTAVLVLAAVAVWWGLADDPARDAGAAPELSERTAQRETPAPTFEVWAPQVDAGRAAAALELEVVFEGAVAAGVKVELEQTQRSFESLTGADGIARFEPLPGPAVIRLSRAEARIAYVTDALPARLRLELKAAPQRKVEVLTDDTDTPIRGARVWVPGPEGLVVEEALTNELGHAVLVQVGDFPQHVFAGASGRHDNDSEFAAVGAPTQVLLSRPEAVEGVVLNDGLPAAKADVWTSRERTRTDARGRFALKAWLPGERVSARQGELGASTELLEGPLELQLRPRSVLKGKVFAGDTDHPFAGAEVEVDGEKTLTAADGSFSVSFLPTESQYVGIGVTAPGFSPLEDVVSTEEPVELLLQAPAAIGGRVITDDEQPVSGARVTVRKKEVLTGADGRFFLEDVAPGPLRVEARAGELRGATEVELPEKQRAEVTVVLEPDAVLQHVEFFADGKKLEHESFKLVAERLDGRKWKRESYWVTRHHGRALTPGPLRLFAGRWEIEASDPNGDWATARQTVTLSVSEKPKVLRFDLKPKPPPPSRPVKVRVTEPDGTGIEGAVVEIFGPSSGGRTGTGGWGDFTLAEEATFPIGLRVSFGGRVALGSLSDFNAMPVIVLPKGARIEGTVSGGQPGDWVEVNSQGELQSFPLEAVDRFALEDRPAFRTIVCLGRRDQRLACDVVVPVPGGTVTARLEAGAPGRVHYKAALADGRPLEQPILYLDRFSTASNAVNGEETLELTPGKHVLVINVAGSEARYETLFEVRPGQTTDLGVVVLR